MAEATAAEKAAVPTAREKLLASARKVLARDGIEGLTLRAIAREAGVSHGAPLRHFPSLARLLSALAAEGFEQLVASVTAALASAEPSAEPSAARSAEPSVGPKDADPRGQVALAGRGYLRFALAEPGVFSVMFRPDLCDIGDPLYQEASAASFTQLMEVAAAAQAAGWQEHMPTARLAAVLWSNVHGLAELWLHGALQAVVDDKDLEALATDLFSLQALVTPLE
jgi:AcrR family transcriptional regulator